MRATQKTLHTLYSFVEVFWIICQNSYAATRFRCFANRTVPCTVWGAGNSQMYQTAGLGHVHHFMVHQRERPKISSVHVHAELCLLPLQNGLNGVRTSAALDSKSPTAELFVRRAVPSNHKYKPNLTRQPPPSHTFLQRHRRPPRRSQTLRLSA